ncbi:MAG TPA: 50S ribosomal protein L10 [Dehalococcoidia bacterium]|jgi:large subunit ribosomal protein L10|nr:50S ribosomal protein L10 [Dehalococcoidia bacterium]
MPREEKVRIVDELGEIFSKCSIGILTDYRGLSTAELSDLRRALRNSGASYRVVKNTLARLAAEKAGKRELVSLFEGPVAIAFGYGDIVEPAKVLADYIRNQKISLGIKGGFAGDRVFTPGDVEALATLPSREVLLGKVLAGVQSPIVSLISYLASPLRGLVGVLQARAKQLEGG